MAEHKFNVIEKREGAYESIKTVKVFDTPGEAMDYVTGLDDPMRLRKVWELVCDGGFNDGVNANKCERTFEYENTHNGDGLYIGYYIEHEVIC